MANALWRFSLFSSTKKKRGENETIDHSIASHSQEPSRITSLIVACPLVIGSCVVCVGSFKGACWGQKKGEFSRIENHFQHDLYIQDCLEAANNMEKDDSST